MIHIHSIILYYMIVCSIACCFSFYPITNIRVTIIIDKSSSSMRTIIFPWTIILCRISPFLNSLTIFKIIYPFSIIGSSWLISKNRSLFSFISLNNGLLFRYNTFFHFTSFLILYIRTKIFLLLLFLKSSSRRNSDFYLFLLHPFLHSISLIIRILILLAITFIIWLNILIISILLNFMI